MKTRCVTVAPFWEEGQTYLIGDEVDLTPAQLARLGGAGLVKRVEETWREIPADCLVTAVVLLYGTSAEEFETWARTIRESTQGSTAKLEVVVVENTGISYADQQANREICDRYGFVYLKSEYNLGFAGGCNFGASQATGDVVVFLNDDMEFAEPWIDTLIEPLRIDQTVAVTGADLQRMGGGDWSAYNRPDWVCGACFAVRRFDFQRFGGFDESYFFSWEETDYCQMVTKLGQRVVQTQAKVIHRGGETAECKSEFSLAQMERGRGIFEAKWSRKRRLVAGLLVGNERGRYLAGTLEWLATRADRIVIVDDASTDGTWEDIQDFKRQYPDKVAAYRNSESMFRSDEHLAREWLHYKVLKEAPTHIMPLDADEILSKRYDAITDQLLAPRTSWTFPIVHYWGDEQHRRIDGMWGEQTNVRLYAVDWSKPQDFYCQPLHCGSAPIYAYEAKQDRNDVALLHRGWIRNKDFERKKKRNQEIDPSGYWEPQAHWFDDPFVVNFEDSGNADVNFKEQKI